MIRKILYNCQFLPLCLAIVSLLPIEGTSADRSVFPNEDFLHPPVTYRPLQIIHGFDNVVASKYPSRPFDKDFLAELVQSSTDGKEDLPDLKKSLHTALQDLKDLGLGGVVCNVSFRDYMRDENQWTLFQWGLEACKDLGLRVWIYDEDGYPSGAAGGLVLKNPAYEAQELILDPTGETKYRIRPAYEGTHASNNYYMARRYPNLLDRDANREFIRVTHDAYAKLCSPDFGQMIEAFFTDEPSLIACNLGQIPEEVRKNVPVRDPIDPKIQRLPSVPWVHDLPELFTQKFGYDLLPKVEALFAGESQEARKIRNDFWSLISDLMETRYFGQIQEWCHAHRLASSGHTLWEEEILYHPPLNGNPLRNLQRMDIPGIDILSSNPGNAFGGYALTAALASSAAKLNGTRRVMTETSDFSEQMAKRSASLEEMCATAGWQYALGVTDFTLYYGRNREGDTYPRYCEFVGRLGALLTDAQRITRVALYYPISDLWTGYIPEAERLSLDSQSPKTQSIVRSFSQTNSQLVRDGVGYCLVDHNHIAQATIEGHQLSVGPVKFDTLVLPVVDSIPAAAQKTIEQFRSAGGRVIDSSNDPGWRDRLQSDLLLKVHSEQPGCLWREFEREDQTIVLFVNTTNQEWNGTITAKTHPIAKYHFSTGSIETFENETEPNYPLKLQPFETLAITWPK